jgi:phosphoribosylglycinamide formyltransferase 1
MGVENKVKRILILTGGELRHIYFRKAMAHDNRFDVVATYCEGTEKSLLAKTFNSDTASWLQKRHVEAREQNEHDFFEEYVSNTKDKSNPIFINKGEVNNQKIVRQIIEHKPDLLVCYGSSLISSTLIEVFNDKFLNVHLGLSPYYRGSGTNIFPIINHELHMVGATFMHIDPGIDTGKIVHQIRADFFVGDSPHSIGNRLIRKMTRYFADLVAGFEDLADEQQPESTGKLYYQRDFDSEACKHLYQALSGGLVEEYLQEDPSDEHAYIVQNRGLTESK